MGSDLQTLHQGLEQLKEYDKEKNWLLFSS